ncbi:flavin reductase domain-containing protein fmn-binding protein [Pochonia chlamydosporia 170]|uniref:Flavin reductase domain-containing protein fmn-binding protein n=1 Tax=Pochonia chlamydosporia 170 TaxID=1380566 RepID=A0A179G6W5_METCM|nr:flavin reductase domain-containing protein fmn-binding protein [Pochonia chlamydosporia 170]OAQ73537.1 flavin reductase domain-containing protein fmn-binding protein [Pochonia chlamydosporia 170]
MTHSIISPAILYFGTPVLLITSENEDTSHNICAISSVFWLGHRCILGFGAASKTPQNILRTKQCVVNLPDETMTRPVNALSTTTGTERPSSSKLARGYRFVKDKWTCAGLTPQPADFVRPPRIRECPVQMECELAGTHDMMEDVPDRKGVLVALELQVVRVHVVDGIRMKGYANRIDPDLWRPLIMSFQELYGLSGRAGESQLGRIDEELYRRATRSDVVKRLGDGDMAMAEEREGRVNGVNGTNGTVANGC